MTGDGGEYLRAEDLRELGDDSLPGQYLDGMNYLRFSLDGGREIESTVGNEMKDISAKISLIKYIHTYIYKKA
uniref:Uncharacterized protein n=1 Tax=Seriola dumerili TaxID=41447 RepID=A0A3B4TDQ0_SERDU